MEVVDEETLTQTVSVLLFSPEQATAMGRQAQAVVLKERGATLKHAEVIVGLLTKKGRERVMV
jgi:3-deoxy-D-manno-octulosonic-acid transferase